MVYDTLGEQIQRNKMPTATYSKAGIELSLDFEVYCKCGNGICSNTEPRKRRGDHENIFETYCDVCKDEKEKAEARVEELEQENKELKGELADMKREIERLLEQQTPAV